MKYIIIQANTQSEWDSIDLAIVELSKENIKRLQDLREVVKSVQNVDGFNKLSVFDGMCEFYTDDDEIYDVDESEYLIEENIDFDSLGEPENRLDTYMISVRENSFSFQCYGKHTGELFESLSVSWNVIENI